MENVIYRDIGMKLITQCILLFSFFFILNSQAFQNIDVNGDGNADILWRNQVTGQNWLWTMNGVVVDESKSLNTIPLNWEIVGRGDFDGDGKSDILWRNNDSGRNYIYLMDGFTIRTSQELNYLPNFDWKVKGVTDLNGDGKDDIVWHHQTTGRTWIYLIDGISITSSKAASTVADLGWEIVGSGDVNGDGNGDVIWRHKTSGANYIWLMNGTSILDSYVLNTIATSWNIVGVGDLNGDGTDDIVLRNAAGLNWAYLMNNGQIATSEQINTIADTQWQIRTIGDLNGDGKADIFWRNQSTGKTYAYLMDGTSILTAGYSSVISLNWKIISTSTLPTEGQVIPEEPKVDESPAYYTENISTQIVQSKCILCHTSGGAAASTRLQFVSSTTENYQTINQQRIADFLALDGVDSSYLLTKAQGGLTHGGGAQIVFASDDYEALATYLGFISGGSNEGEGETVGFWQGVGLLNHQQTLRKAALILAGRLPTEEEYSSISNNKESSLKIAIRNVMQGNGFHQFLSEGANDRLLTHKFIDRGTDFLDLNSSHLIEGAKLQFEYAKQERSDEFWDQHRPAEIGFAKAATELIAYVVENEKPYTEILTANYTMVTPRLNIYYDGDAQFVNPDNVYEFSPAKMHGYMLHTENLQEEFEQGFGIRVDVEGERITWPHAGILNDPAFLSRYPSTATNRNRARSRWTQYFFLDFDIEKSSARTNDPDALADRDNPTMNNSHCTVCHIPMDPVAGAFQNYGDVGYYRDQWGGKDSLANTYKWPEDGNSPYQEGDTWYRDMRAPGFYGEDAPNADNSLQWLAQQIINDNRFSTSAVKFWWWSVIGTSPVYAPENSSDYDYETKTTVFNEQSAFITDLSDDLREHMNLKDTLVDMVMSPWFRANEISAAQADVHASNVSGAGRLLSPELLDQKTIAVMGRAWGEHYPEWKNYERYSTLVDEYKLSYGGIDSEGVTKRTENITSIMSQIALTQAAEMSCPIVVDDFAKPDEERRLFAGLSKYDTPLLINNVTHNVSGYGPQEVGGYVLNTTLEQGTSNLTISFLSDWGDNDFNNDLFIDSLTIRDNNNNLILEYDIIDLLFAIDEKDCGGLHWDDFIEGAYNIWGNCFINLPIEIPQNGDYTIEVFAFGVTWQHETNEIAPIENVTNREFEMNIATRVTNINTQFSPTKNRIKEKIVKLVENAWGSFLTVDDPEIETIFNLFEASRQARIKRSSNQHIVDDAGNCDFDFGLYDTESRGGWEVGNDPYYVMSAWRTVIAYIMSDYQYIHE